MAKATKTTEGEQPPAADPLTAFNEAVGQTSTPADNVRAEIDIILEALKGITTTRGVQSGIVARAIQKIEKLRAG